MLSASTVISSCLPSENVTRNVIGYFTTLVISFFVVESPPFADLGGIFKPVALSSFG